MGPKDNDKYYEKKRHTHRGKKPFEDGHRDEIYAVSRSRNAWRHWKLEEARKCSFLLLSKDI